MKPSLNGILLNKLYRLLLGMNDHKLIAMAVSNTKQQLTTITKTTKMTVVPNFKQTKAKGYRNISLIMLQ